MLTFLFSPAVPACTLSYLASHGRRSFTGRHCTCTSRYALSGVERTAGGPPYCDGGPSAPDERCSSFPAGVGPTPGGKYLTLRYRVIKQRVYGRAAARAGQLAPARAGPGGTGEPKNLCPQLLRGGGWGAALTAPGAPVTGAVRPAERAHGVRGRAAWARPGLGPGPRLARRRGPWPWRVGRG